MANEERLERLLSKVVPVSDAEADKSAKELESLKANFRKGYAQITEETNTTKTLITSQAPEPPEQGVFSFLPTALTRTSPFFPMSKREMKNRSLPPGGLSWETSWGRMTIKGEKLSIHDESVLLAVLSLMKTHQSETFRTTKHELCKVMNVTPAKSTYQGIWGSLDRLTGAKITLEIWEPKTKKKKTKRRMTNTILAGAVEEENTGKLLITVNPYFLRMYAESLITNINLEFRTKLKGDITKSLYRFYRSQAGMEYECHLLTLCRAINLDMNTETFRLRARIKNGLKELKKAGYLKRHMVMKSDIVKIWKRPKAGACTIEDGKGRKPAS